MNIQNLRQKKWYVIDSEANRYSENEPIKFLTRPIQSSLCDFSDAYVLVTGDITVTGANDNKKFAFENCASFRKCITNINETFIDKVDSINITMLCTI